MKKRNKLPVISLMIIILCEMTVSAQMTVPVSHSSCEYSIVVPAGWNIIPMDTIKSKLNIMVFDLGIYPVSQEHYFAENYVLTGFLPTPRSLSAFTFQQITTEITQQNRQSEITSDTMDVRFVKIVPDARNHCLHSYFSIRKDTVSLENCQSLYLTKFGYVTVLSYQKTGAVPLDEIGKELTGLIQIQNEYKYAEPEKKGITVRHLIISLTIGLLAYAIILVFTKKRAAS